MKNKKPSSHANLLTSKSSVSETSRSQTDVRRRKTSGNSFFKKTAEVLQTYKGIFTKPPGHSSGHADTIFKQSLRNYDDFEITTPVKWETKQEKLIETYKTVNIRRKQLESHTFEQGDYKPPQYIPKPRTPHTDRVQKSQPTHVGRKPFQFSKSELEFLKEKPFEFAYTEEKLLEENGVKQEEEEDPEETDLDVFYSPNSQLEQPDSEKESEEESTNDINKDFYISAVQPREALDSEFETESLKVVEVETEKESIMADEELQQVENLVQQAGNELNDVVANLDYADTGEGEEDTAMVESEDNAETLMDSTALESETGEAEENTEALTVSNTETSAPVTTATDSAGKSAIGYDPNIDAAVIKELEEAEKAAMETAKIIYELKQRVAQLLSKAKMTETEGRELEEKNEQLRQQMSLFEAKTKKIQFLVDQASLFENMKPRPPNANKKHNEDLLPKVIICGVTENNMPKIIVCDDKKQKPCPQPKTAYTMPPPVVCLPITPIQDDSLPELDVLVIDVTRDD